MTTNFNTEIVKTKEFNKILKGVFGILYNISTFYLFIYDNENLNPYFKYLAIAVWFLGFYFLFGQSFIKPKKNGNLKISTEKIEFSDNRAHKSITPSNLEAICLKYMDYGGWTTHSLFGNKNYLTITEKSGDKYIFEILIRNRTSKNDLKRVLNSPEFYEKFDVIKANNSRTEF